MVSIILCTYNRAHTLKATIDSILAQTYTDFELILVDDGSTDQTQKLLARYSDERIRSYVLEENSFYCAAANFGLTKAKGDYIAFATSDDVWNLRKLERQLDYMEKRKDCGACFTFVHMIDENGNNADEKYKDMLNVFRKVYYSRRDWIQRFIFEGNCLCHPTSVVRKEVLDKVGGYHVFYSLLADMELWLRIVRYYPIHVIEEDLLGYRMFADQTKQISGATEKKMTKSLNEHMLIRNNFINEVSDQELEDFFANKFQYKEAYTHQEMEIERALLLLRCVDDLPELGVLGVEKFEKLLREPEYVKVLKDTYQIRLQDIYQWNTKHFYMDYTIHTLLGQKDRQIERQTEDIHLLQKHIEEIEAQRAELYRKIENEKRCAEKMQQIIDIRENEFEKLKSEIELSKKEVFEEKQKVTLLEKECKDMKEENQRKSDLLNRALLEKLELQEKK